MGWERRGSVPSAKGGGRATSGGIVLEGRLLIIIIMILNFLFFLEPFTFFYFYFYFYFYPGGKTAANPPSPSPRYLRCILEY